MSAISRYTGKCEWWEIMSLFIAIRSYNAFARIRTTPHQDKSPSYRYWSWWEVFTCWRGPGGKLFQWGVVLGIVVLFLVGRSWTLFLSCGELSWSPFRIIIEFYRIITCQSWQNHWKIYITSNSIKIITIGTIAICMHIIWITLTA